MGMTVEGALKRLDYLQSLVVDLDKLMNSIAESDIKIDIERDVTLLLTEVRYEIIKIKAALQTKVYETEVDM